tara:strand:+ start:1209 stop:2015 length:807 start_codon:yes stop_codon:yes gene_type:complete
MTQETFGVTETLVEPIPVAEEEETLADDTEESAEEQATEKAPVQSPEQLTTALGVANSAREKAERDLKAISRGRERQSARDERIVDIINANQDATNKAILALAKAFSDPEGVEEALGSIETERRTSEAQGAFESRYQRLWDSLMENTEDDDGNQVFNIRDPKYADFHAEWVKAQKSGNLAELAVLVGRSSAFRIAAEREKTTTAQNGNRQSRSRLDLDTGATGSAGTSDQALVDAFGDPNQILTKEETKKAIALMDKGLTARPLSKRS